MNSRIIRKDSIRASTRFPLIGRIRCGEKRKKPGGGEYPVSLDYFKATGDYASKFNEAYPDKPSTIQVIFISDDNMQSCFEQFDGRDEQGRRAGYGDGETFWIYNNGSGEYDPTQDRSKVEQVSKERKIKWKPVLTINFLIPAIKGVFGIWQFQTSGDKSSSIAIASVYDEIKAQAGTVINIPFDLTVKKVTSNKPGSKSVYPVVNLVPNISHENMEQLRKFMEHGLDIKKIGMLTEDRLASLPAPEDDAQAVEVLPDKDTSEERKSEGGSISDELRDNIKKIGFTEDEINQATNIEPPKGTLFKVEKE